MLVSFWHIFPYDFRFFILLVFDCFIALYTMPLAGPNSSRKSQTPPETHRFTSPDTGFILSCSFLFFIYRSLFDCCVFAFSCRCVGCASLQQKLQTCPNSPQWLAVVIDIQSRWVDWGRFGKNLFLLHAPRQSRIPHPFIWHRQREPYVHVHWDCHVPYELV